MHFALISAAVHWCWGTTHLYEEQIFIDGFAMTQPCCEPFLQSSTKQWAMHFALICAAVHWCWGTTYLYEEHSFTDDFAVTQACCQPVLQSSTEQWECILPQPVPQCIGVGSKPTVMNSNSSLGLLQ